MGQRFCQRRAQAFLRRVNIQANHRQLNMVFFEPVDARETAGGQKLAIHPQMGEASRTRPIGQLGVHAFTPHHQRCEQANVLAAVVFHQLRGNAVGRLGGDGSAVFDAVLRAQLDIEQPQKVPDLGGGSDGGFAPSPAQALLDGHCGRNAVDRVHLRATGRLHDGAGVGVQAFQVAALAFVEQDVKRQGRFAGSADTGDHAEFAARNVNTEGPEVVLFRIDDANVVVGLRRCGAGRKQLCKLRCRLLHVMHHAHGGSVFAQRFGRVAGGMQEQVLGRTVGHHMATGLSTLGTQVDQPVTGTDHIQVVLNHHQRVAHVEQFAQGAHQLGDVVKMQTGGGLVQHEQSTPARQGLATRAAGFGGFGQESGQLQTLRLAP